MKFLLFSLTGGLIMLVAVIGLYLQGPRGDDGFLISSLTGLHLAEGTQRWLFLGFFIAFAVKEQYDESKHTQIQFLRCSRSGRWPVSTARSARPSRGSSPVPRSVVFGGLGLFVLAGGRRALRARPARRRRPAP